MTKVKVDQKSKGDKSKDSGAQPFFKKVRFWIITISSILVILFFIGIGVVIGTVVVPRVRNWLTDHNFIEGSAQNGEQGSGGTTITGTREVVVEENWVTDVVASTREGVVSVAVSQDESQEGADIEDQSVNIGTGFVIDESGLVLTNQHVVTTPRDDYVVITSDGKEYEVEDIARDNVNDLAILEVNGNDLKSLTLGNSDNLQVGQFVVAIGTPLGELSGSVTSGIISGLGRSVTASSGGFWGSSRTYEGVIQTDTAINPGNSGGPLLDSSGSVIGISFATTSGADNISFALPINVAKNRISEYKKHGEFIKPFIGVEYSIVSPTMAMFYDNLVAGAYVKGVVPESPADKAGIKRGDIITEVDGEDVGGSFSILIQKHEVGDEIDVKYYRDGEYITKKVTLEKMN